MINVRWRKRAMMKLDGIADEAGQSGGKNQAAKRLAPDEFGEQAGGIGADAEEGGMAERNNAGIAEDEIER